MIASQQEYDVYTQIFSFLCSYVLVVLFYSVSLKSFPFWFPEGCSVPRLCIKLTTNLLCLNIFLLFPLLRTITPVTDCL